MVQSSFSGQLWESLFNLYLGIALLVGALVLGWLTWSLVKYRARPGDLPPPDAPRAGHVTVERGHVIYSWVLAGTIAAIMFGLAFSTIHAVDSLENPPPDEEKVWMDVTGFQFGWRVEYTGTGGVPLSKVGDWSAPVDTAVVMNVTSQDVWHNFALPNFRIRVDAIPGETNLLWFKAHETGEERPVCVQICGVGHALMHAKMTVVTKEQWRQLIEEESIREYERLLRGSRVSAVNATTDGETLAFEVTSVPAGRPLVFNVTNTAGTPLTLVVHDRVVELPADGYGYAYLPAQPVGGVEVMAGSARETLQVVS